MRAPANVLIAALRARPQRCNSRGGEWIYQLPYDTLCRLGGHPVSTDHDTLCLLGGGVDSL